MKADLMPIQAAWVPPDGGFGWVVAVLSLLLHGQSLGMVLAMSVMYVSWLEAFDGSRGFTSWIISISVAVMCALGPLPAALANRYGFRVVIIVGGLLTSAGYILSYFATSVAFLVFTFGIITGLGCCFTLLSAVAIVSLYFEERRSVAMGIGTSGVGIGSLVAAPILNYLTEMYGWRGALLIIGATSLHICAYGLLLRPVIRKEVNEEKEVEDQKQSVLIQENQNDIQKLSVANGNIKESPKISIKSFREHNRASSHYGPIENHIDPVSSSQGITQHQMSSSRVSIQFGFRNFSENQCDERPYSSLKDLRKRIKVSSRHNLPHYLRSMGLKNSLDAIFVRSMNYKMDSVSLLEDENDLLEIANDIKDQSDDQVIQYKNTSPQTEVKVTGKKSPNSFSFRESLRDLINTNKEIFKDPMFFLFFISNIVTNLSYIAPTMYLMDRAVDLGLSKTVGALLVAINGAGNIFGRIFFGAITYRLFPDRLMNYIIVLSLGGIFTMISPLCGSNAILHSIYAFIVGWFIGGYGCLVAVVCVDLMGLSRASESFGLLLTSWGIATLVGTPFAGVLFDWTRNYTVTYALYGFFLIASALILLPSACRRRRKRKRDEKELRQEKTQDSLLVLDQQ